MPLETLIAAQANWARSQWPGHTSKRAPSLDDNLVHSLDVNTRAEFEAGSGGELGRNGNPGKMSSLRSSSALSFNFFGPWRNSDLTPLATALHVSVQSRGLRFEQKYRHGLGSTPPNLDVVLDFEMTRPLGIECKFTEPYGKKKEHEPLNPKYFAGGRLRWTEVHLPKCQKLANAVGTTTAFRRLAAGQLLKHLLGLARTSGQLPRLRYVWFDSLCEEAKEHRGEINRFAAHIDDSIDFHAVTYQEVFSSIRSSPEPVRGYHSYLAERYFVA